MIDQANIPASTISSPRSLPRLSDSSADYDFPPPLEGALFGDRDLQEQAEEPEEEEESDEGGGGEVEEEEEETESFYDLHDVLLDFAAATTTDMACFTITSAVGGPILPTAFSLEDLSPEECRDLSAACFPVNGRSKSFGNTVSKAFNEAVSKLEMGHDSRNKQFHKLFPCVPDTEAVINSYSCALVKDILLQGRLFISENWICFHSNIFTYEKQIAIRLETVTKITKERTAFVVPNAIGLHTPSEKHIFGSLLSRHSTHQLLYRVWKNAKGETESMSPESSLQGESDDEDIPGDSDEEDSLDGDCDGQNGRVLSSVSVHERLDPGGSSMGGSRHGSPRQPRMTSSDLAHSMGELSGQRHRSRHHGYHHQLSQMLCSVSIFKSIKRIGGSLKQLPQYQPFLFLIGILLLCLTVSAAVLTVRIWRLQPSAAPLAPHAAPLESVHLESMGSIGDLFLTEQHRHQEKVSNIQDTLTANLKALLKVQNSLRDMRKSAAEESSILAAESESPCLTEMGKEDL